MKHAYPICTFLQLLFASALSAQLGCLWSAEVQQTEAVWWRAAAGPDRELPVSGSDHPDQYAAVGALMAVPVSSINVACYKNRSNGFHGLHIPFEPSVARLNFNKNLPYRNTWMGGGYAGIDFNPFVGIRGFYFKAMNFGKIKIDEEKLTMYGSEMRLRIPIGKSLVPTMMLGGGYMNVNGNYKARDVYAAKSQFFAQTGLGLSLPLTDNFQVQCGARAVLMSDPHLGANGLRTSCMYNLGIRLTLSKKVRFPFLNFPTWNRQD